MWPVKQVIRHCKKKREIIPNIIRNHTFQFCRQHREHRQVGTGQLWTQCSAARDRCSEEWPRRLSQTPAQATTSNDTWLISAQPTGHKPPKSHQQKCTTENWLEAQLGHTVHLPTDYHDDVWSRPGLQSTIPTWLHSASMMKLDSMALLYCNMSV